MTLERMRRRIILRADGNHIIGLGHLIRSLALLEMLMGDFECVFITRKDSDPQTKKMIAGHCALIEIDATDSNESAILESLLKSDDILILDGYQFNVSYQKNIRAAVRKLVVIDDLGKGHFFADLIINHGNKDLATAYETEPFSKVLAGFDYLLLRKFFLKAAGSKRDVKKAENCFICFGGADSYNITCKVLEACIETDFLKQIIIVTGSAYQHADALQTLIEKYKELKVIIHEKNVDEQRLVALIRKAEIAIAPASSVSLEICCVKAGLLTGIFVDNQQSIHNQLITSDCALSVGNFSKITALEIKESLKEMKNTMTINRLMAAQHRAIDGKSGERLRKEFARL